MVRVSGTDAVYPGEAALVEGRWDEARDAFEAVLEDQETGAARFGLAVALWWLGENHRCVEQCSRAYALFRRADDVERAAQSAIWLAITYKANFANFAAANGWIARAERLLAPLDVGPLHGWVDVARAYRMADLDTAEVLAARAVDVARAAGDVDLELVALSQLGLVRVGKGDAAAGFALIDEAMAAALAGERSTLDTVVYACCDMLNACELASDIERAAQWCTVADDFVDTYGCPFLYAECRIFYGSVLAAKGRWGEAERELSAGLRITDGACPGLHAKALVRMAGLRIRQGRLEEAEQLMSCVGDAVATETEQALWMAALMLARADAAGARRNLEQRLDHLAASRAHLVAALDLLVEAHLTVGDVDAAATAAGRLAAVAADTADDRLRAIVSGADGRVAAARGDSETAIGLLETTLRLWSQLELPFEAARARVELGRLLAGSRPDVAVDHARRALSAFETLGAAHDADRTAALLRSLGVTARTGPKGVGALTLREREVLRLLGAGLSNPEIAARLHVSRKTAAHHVSNILAKLGLRNRAEAAAYAVANVGQGAGPVSPAARWRRRT
jgi:DNA-binding CsgD family transcriptional regulator